MIVSPELELKAFWNASPPEWEGRLRTALDLHRRHAMPDGLGEPSPIACVALGPLAFAALRFAAGLPGNVAAPELPPALVERGYRG